jgi:FkbM family methyltransferase
MDCFVAEAPRNDARALHLCVSLPHPPLPRAPASANPAPDMNDHASTHSTEGNGGPAFGAFAPAGFVARAVAWTRRLGAGWGDKRLASALRRIAIGRLHGQPVDTTTLGARMRLYPHNNLCDKRILFTPQLFDVAERAVLAQAIARVEAEGRGFNFVDIGANVGAYSLFVAAQAGHGEPGQGAASAPAAHILAIEPQPDIFARLVTNIGFNSFGSIMAVDCAVADKPGELTLFIDPRNKGESSVRLLRSSAATAVKVPARPLTQLLADHRYSHIDALKIDVEGAEDVIIEPFLRDAPETLWPKLIIIEDSVHRWQVDLRALFLKHGYRELPQTRLNLMFTRG